MLKYFRVGRRYIRWPVKFTCINLFQCLVFQRQKFSTWLSVANSFPIPIHTLTWLESITEKPIYLLSVLLNAKFVLIFFFRISSPQIIKWFMIQIFCESEKLLKNLVFWKKSNFHKDKRIFKVIYVYDCVLSVWRNVCWGAKMWKKWDDKPKPQAAQMLK